MERKYKLTLNKLNKLPMDGTLVIVVDSLSKVQKWVKDIKPHLKGYVLMGQGHRIYFPAFRTCIKFVTIGTLFILGNMFFTDKEVDLHESRGSSVLSDKDVNPFIVIDLHDVPDHEFGEFISSEDAMLAFELIAIKRGLKGESTAYNTYKPTEMPVEFLKHFSNVGVEDKAS